MKPTSPQSAVELFHLLILDLFSRKTDRNRYALKGGCNLRFFHKSIRYSEDLDIDLSARFTKDKLADAVEGIITSKTLAQLLELRGMRIAEWSAPKQTDTTQRWKFGLEWNRQTPWLRTKIEFSRRGMNDGIIFDPIDPYLIRTYRLTPVLVSHYDANTALKQKIRALADRRQVQARDVFDIDLLLNSGACLDKPGGSRHAQAATNALNVSFDMFKAQVLSFLHPDHQAQFDSPTVWDEMVLRVVTALEVPS